jgi:hypothetical protein
VHDGDGLATHVRMRIALGRHAMGRPAGVSDTEIAFDTAAVDHLLQLGDLADRADALQPGITVAHGNAG